MARKRKSSTSRTVAVPKTPTDHLPGTAGKLTVMADRVRRGETLFHPRDARVPEDLTPQTNTDLLQTVRSLRRIDPEARYRVLLQALEDRLHEAG